MAAGTAFAFEKEPVSGGLLALPGDEAPAPITAEPPAPPPPALVEQQEVPVPAVQVPPVAPVLPPAPAPAPAPAKIAAEPPKEQEDDTSCGVLLRGGYFGVPNFIADKLFVQHPDISGSSYGAEIRYHGDDGGRGVASIGLAIDSATASADGDLQQNDTDKVVTANGEVSMLAITITGYWSMFPSWYVHPYVGLGIGVAHAKGFYINETERVDADVWAPVLHIPIGLAVELGKTFQLALEGRFIDGIAIGGALQVRF
jgi:hypothetical protein